MTQWTIPDAPIAWHHPGAHGLQAAHSGTQSTCHSPRGQHQDPGPHLPLFSFLTGSHYAVLVVLELTM